MVVLVLQEPSALKVHTFDQQHHSLTAIRAVTYKKNKIKSVFHIRATTICRPKNVPDYKKGKP